jgi:hypothetical protein
MADQQRDQLESFRTFIKAAEEGAAIPPVTKEDLKVLHEISVDMARRHLGKDGVASVNVMARACSPEANLPAVWFRYTRLRSLVKQGVLAEWQHTTDLDDVVFQVAASIPMNGLKVDQEAFIQQLRHQAVS